MRTLRPCGSDDLATLLTIINAAAEAYRGVIPPDNWHEPYMSEPELITEIAAGVAFWGLEMEGQLVGVMGIQPVRDVYLIRHAYVRPSHQRQGVGAELIEHLRRRANQRMLVGTWAAATWAISFYERHGFARVAQEHTAVLLRGYWTIPERQVATSVVLASPPL